MEDVFCCSVDGFYTRIHKYIDGEWRQQRTAQHSALNRAQSMAKHQYYIEGSSSIPLRAATFHCVMCMYSRDGSKHVLSYVLIRSSPCEAITANNNSKKSSKEIIRKEAFPIQWHQQQFNTFHFPYNRLELKKLRKIETHHISCNRSCIHRMRTTLDLFHINSCFLSLSFPLSQCLPLCILISRAFQPKRVLRLTYRV